MEPQSGIATVTVHEIPFNVAVANSFAELTSGLSGVTSLAEGSGVLFDLGGVQGSIAINMGQMLFPLDIIFISEDLLVLAVENDVQPGASGVGYDGFPGARFFLEVNSGEAEDVEVGDIVTLSGYTPANTSTSTSFDITTVFNMMILVMVMGMMGKMVTKMLASDRDQRLRQISSTRRYW